MRGCFTCRFRPRGNGEGGGSSVHSNHAPVLQLPLLDAEVRTGEGFSYMFAADAFIDPDDAPLTYAATLEEGLDLPSWLTFDSPPPPPRSAARAGRGRNLQRGGSPAQIAQLVYSRQAVLIIAVRVAQCGRYAGVPKDFPHGIQIHSTHGQVAGCDMPQRVKRDSPQARPCRRFF